MKIEELYTKSVSIGEPETCLPEPETGASKEDVPATETDKKTKSCKCKSARPTSSKRKQSISTASASRQRRRQSKMKLEQLNRHEEYSYLLEAETNQAILENIVCKDEICRYLSPLKFIEIDSWRREVPYGLKYEADTERRKWRTPIEILYGQKEIGREQADSSLAKKAKQQIPLSASHMKLRRKYQLKNLEGKDLNKKEDKADAVACENYEDDANNHEQIDASFKTGAAWQRRPATSPERKTILNKMRNEKILSRHQVPGAPTYSIRNKIYSSHDALASAFGGLYSRSPISSTTSLRPTTSATQSKKFRTISQDSPLSNSLYKAQKREIGYYHQYSNQVNAMRPRVSSDQTGYETYFPSVRPRTRGNANRSTQNLQKQMSSENLSATQRQSHVPRPPDQKEGNISCPLSSFHLDPNIVYIPQSYRKNNSSQDADNGAVQLKAADKSNAKAAVKTKNTVAPNEEITKHNQTPAVTEETVRLPRDSLFSSKPSPRISESLTPRIIPTNEVSTYRSWTSKLTSSSLQSPWVTQALPDFSKKDVISKAEKDGYYVRKANKTVSFRTSEGESDKRKEKPYLHNGDSTPKNSIAMVVVNVDKPSEATNKLLPHGGAMKLSQKAPDFTGTNVISVRQ